MADRSSNEWQTATDQLIAQRTAHVGQLCGWADYEIRAVGGEGGFLDQATYALGFNEQNFGMQDTQAVSCEVCGGLFLERLEVMRRHRLQCGWH
ncbi:hypothetical protein SEA_KARHDO_41 [Mycobacterium phage Karhdo]|nr:hypothetical protein SEA_KARHDO_41 [Mycobacterium phage Karhdo]